MQMANVSLILTIIADDRPGLVGQLSSVVSAHQGNWLESSMSQLAGKFAGILRVDVAAANAVALEAAINALPDLQVVVQTTSAEIAKPHGRHLTLSLVGHDRIGIVRQVTQVLVRHGLNVESLNTFVESAPMSADLLFHADAELTAPSALDARALKGDLESISNDLMVDITLGEIV
jgi:glycine cleavage system regulatory protein